MQNNQLPTKSPIQLKHNSMIWEIPHTSSSNKLNKLHLLEGEINQKNKNEKSSPEPTITNSIFNLNE